MRSRCPICPGYAVGYLQKGSEINELAHGSSSFKPSADGLVASGILNLGEGEQELIVDVRPRGFGPLLLTAPDGRVSHFVRAFADFRTSDGRSGVGWIEWNINQSRELSSH